MANCQQTRNFLLVRNLEQVNGALDFIRQLLRGDETNHGLDGSRVEVVDRQSVGLTLDSLVRSQHPLEDSGLFDQRLLVAGEVFVGADDFEVAELHFQAELHFSDIIITKC